MRRLGIILPATLLGVLLAAGPAFACGGLIGPNGAVNLLRTTTFAGYHDGTEHYVTAFQFAGGGGAFGSITPLPAVPSSVVKGGDWTLQRLVQETSPIRFSAADSLLAAASAGAEEIMKVRIDALDITVLRGGAADIGTWATDHGFRLPPDAPEVLDFYAERSPIFLAAAFDADAAAERGQQLGDGTPVHITIPTDNPWVPLRILALGKTGSEQIQADVYLLTDDAPALLPAPTGKNGIRLDHSAAATDGLLTDLRTDSGMEWIPSTGWLTKIAVDSAAADLTYDLAIDASGAGVPSRVDAGFELPSPAAIAQSFDGGRLILALVFSIVGVFGVYLMTRYRPGGAVR
jgi:hypothetical protein